MRIKFQNSIKLANLAREFEALVEDLAANGVDELIGLNLYFNPVVAGDRAVFRNEQGVEVDVIVVNGRTARAYATASAQSLTAEPAPVARGGA